MALVPTPSIGPLWRIEAYKYGGQLHYTLPAHFIEDDGERLWLRTLPGAEINHLTRGKVWAIRRPSDMIFWRERWYNVYVNYDEAGRFNHFYCNVGLPPEIGERRVSFIDLDLDVQITPDGQHEILDEDEFEAHRILYAYPAAVQQTARQTVGDILAQWRSRVPPFSWFDGDDAPASR